MLRGGSGDDVLAGLAGADTLIGDAGADTVDYSLSDAGVTINLITQAASGGHATGDVLTGFERVIGSTFNDVLTGDSVANVLSGGDGDDMLGASGGADVIDGGDGADVFVQGIEASVDILIGGAGIDLVTYAFADSGVIVQLSGYSASGGATLATFTGIESAIGSSFNDALIGNAGNNGFEGRAGSDWIVGGAGEDWFLQGTEDGLDRIFGDAGIDTLDYRAAIAGVTVQLSGYSTGGGVTLATFTNIENAGGSAFDDALIGTAGNNRIAGGAGSDWLVGQGGDDWFVQGTEGGLDRLFGDAGSDTIDYSGAGVGVTVQLVGWSTVVGGATLATFTGIENAVGSAFNDALIGSALDNRITGGIGADWLVGGDGDDTFVQTIDTSSVDRLFGGTLGADSGLSDTIDYSGASAGVVVQLSGYATTNGGGNIALATFTGIENAVGSVSNDALIGNASDNRITGGGGGDWLVGGLGADTFIYQAISDGAGDSIRDFAQGADHIDLSVIDAISGGADDPFTLANVRHAGVLGEAVVASFGASSLVSLYLDADNVADMTLQVVHGQGVVLGAGDFVL